MTNGKTVHSTSTPNRSIAIIGAGIAGLSSAICLSLTAKDNGVSPLPNIQIFEAAALPSEEGAGLQLSPNITHILRKIGVLDNLLADAGQPQNIIMANGKSGKQIADIPLGDFAKNRYGAPYIVANRADLHQSLLVAAAKHPNIQINFAHKLTNVTKSNGIHQLSFAHNGQTIRHKADLFLAADGVWSPTKEALKLPTFNPPKFSGHIAWRTMLDASKFDAKYQKSTFVWLGANAHIVLYPLRNGQQLNLVIFTEGSFKQKDWAQQADISQLHQHLQNWHADVQFLLSTTQNIKIWPLCAGQPEYQTAQDNILLIGDAAHPTLPYQAQGAAMAIEDAACLANLLYTKQGECWHNWSTASLEKNLRKFEASRHERVTKTQKTAQNNAKIFHARGAVAMARDAYLRFTTKFFRQKLLTRLDWLYAKRYDNF